MAEESLNKWTETLKNYITYYIEDAKMYGQE
jgi:hypothetical protein